MSGEIQSVVLYDASDGIARITLNRPDKRNALNDELIAGMKDALRRANDDSQVRAVILSGAGDDFCSGADLAALQNISTASVQDNLDDARSLMELFLLIRALRPPVIAAVRGRALAGGCGLALACDMVIAEQSAQFGFPEVKVGFVPAMVTAILRRAVSERKAFELIALGGAVSAAEAASWGLINRAVAGVDFESHVQSLAGSLAKLSPNALALSKGLLYKTDGLALNEALAFGMDVNVVARMSQDCQKSIARFLSKE